MNVLKGILATVAGLALVATVSYAAPACCTTGAECCKPEAECCEVKAAPECCTPKAECCD